MRAKTRAILMKAYGDYPDKIDEFLSEGDNQSPDLLIPSFEKFMENNGYFITDED